MHRPSLTSFFAWKPTAFHICIRKYMVCQGFSRNERFVQRQSVRPHKLNNPNLFQQPKQVSKLHRQPSSIVGSSGPMDRAHRSHRWGHRFGSCCDHQKKPRIFHSGQRVEKVRPRRSFPQGTFPLCVTRPAKRAWIRISFGGLPSSRPPQMDFLTVRGLAIDGPGLCVC